MIKMRYNQKGYIGITVVLVISVVTLTVGSSIALLGINEMQAGDETSRSARAFQRAEACSEEAYYRLKRDSGYSGGTVLFSEGVCTVVVTGSGGSRTITSTATYDDFTRSVVSDIDFASNIEGNTDGVDLTDWQE